MGDLSGWTATGSAFDDQPTKGDNPRARNAEVSNMAGTYWIGTFEAYDGVSGAPGDTGGESRVPHRHAVARMIVRVGWDTHV
jgi:hypothetical protein